MRHSGAMVIRTAGRLVLRSFVVVVILGVGAVGTLMILDKRARDRDEVQLIEVPFSDDFGATTIGRIIFINSDRVDDPELIAHELVHVCQWEEQGIEFLWDYTSEFVTNYAELGDLREAYVDISFEQDARDGAIDCDIDLYRTTPTPTGG